MHCPGLCGRMPFWQKWMPRRPADDLEPDHRELLIPFGGSGYAVFYEVQGEEVLILALKHQREAGYGE